MQSNYPDWLARAQASGQGGITLKDIPRGLVWSTTLNFGEDWDADTFFISLREKPDAADPVLVSVTTSVGSYANGVTPVTLSLTAVQTAALPADDNDDGLKELFWDLLRRVGGSGDRIKIMAGNVFVSGKVTPNA